MKEVGRDVLNDKEERGKLVDFVGNNHLRRAASGLLYGCVRIYLFTFPWRKNDKGYYSKLG